MTPVSRCGRDPFRVSDQIRVLGPYDHQDIADKLNNGCGIFREELEVHLSGVKDVQEVTAQGAQQLASDVNNKLIQNDQKNATQQGAINGLFAAMR